MLRRIGAEEGGEFKAIASGTLPSGKPVIVNADGTVSVVAETPVTESAGTPVEWNANVIRYTSAAYDANAQKVVVAYYDFGDSGHGYAAVGTVSGTSISFGTPVEFENAEIDDTAISYDTNAQKVLITYQDVGNSNYGTAIVGTVSGTSISFGTATVFKSAGTFKHASVYDPDSQKIIIASGQNSASPQAAVATISGTSVSFGSLATYGGTNDTGHAMAYDTNTDRVVIAYRDGSNTYVNSVVGTVSGTSISFGTEVVVSGSGAEEEIGIAYDSNNQKIVIGFTQSDVAKGIVGTVSGTSISYGTAANFNSGNTARKIRAVYDSNAQKVVFFFQGPASTYYGQAVSGTVSGTSISFGSVTTFQSSRTEEIAAVYDANAQKSVVVYRDYAQSRGDAVVFTTGYTSQNLTSENYIGMSRGVAVQTGEAGSIGTAVSFEPGLTEVSHAAFDSSNNKVVIAYVDGDDTNKGKAVVATVSGTSISFGSPVTYEAGNTANIDCVFDNSNNKIVILFQDNGDSGRGKGIVGTVSGTSISFGSPTQFNGSGADNAYNIAAAFDSSNNKVVVAYRDGGNSNYGTAAVGTVSGTSISFGTPVVYESANSQQTAVVFDSSNNKVVIGYKDGGNSDHGTAIVGTVSGTSISFGSAVVFNAGETSQIVGAFDSSNNKIVLAYRDNGNSDQGTAIVGTVSGTSISFGSEVIFNTGNTQGTSAVFDSNANKVVISYEDRGDSDYGKFIVGTVSGTSISFDTETNFSGSNAVAQTGAAFDSNANKVVIAFMNDTDSNNRGEGIVANISTIGTTRGEVADGGNASVDVIGSVSDNQIGLTAGQQYFVQTDGTISTTADSPSVLAGTAISATELVVKT